MFHELNPLDLESLKWARGLQRERREYRACYATVVGGVVAVGGAALSASQDTTGGASVPKPAMYQPVDFGESQRNTIDDNILATPQLELLGRETNKMITAESLRRIRRLYPGYNQAIKSYASAGNDLLSGHLPFNDALDVVANRSALGANLGTPGTSGPATLRDLGMSELGAIQAGGGIMKDIVGMAETISPRSLYFDPRTMFMDPTTRAQMDMQQAQLVQQSQQNANNLAAAGDPAAAAQAQTMSGIGGQISGIGQSLLGGGFGKGGFSPGGSGGSGGGVPKSVYSGWAPGPQEGTYYVPKGVTYYNGTVS